MRVGVGSEISLHLPAPLRTLATKAMVSICELRIKDTTCRRLSQLFTKLEQFIIMSQITSYILFYKALHSTLQNNTMTNAQSA